MSRFKIAVGVALVAFVYFYYFNSSSPKLPKLNENEWWGPGNQKQINPAVVPFKIKVSDSDINDLNERLSTFLRKKHLPPLEKQGFQYGFNTNFLQQVVTYWKNDYNWKKRENYLNQYPQFKTEINGLSIHFIRVVPEKAIGKKVLPLLLLHGWPGSVLEFYEVIPLLTTPRKDSEFVFEVIAPSLPGYGFSQGSSKTGFGPPQIAVVFKNLMNRLKLNKFYVAGGDWGAMIGKNLGQLYPEDILGFHSTMCIVNTPLSNLKWFLGSIYPPLVVDSHNQNKLYPLSKVLSFMLNEMGYMLLQATKPDTIGMALSDTPAGLAAYILEKFSTWTNSDWRELPDGGLLQKYSLDSLLDNVMIYWVSNSIMTSQRLYSEAFRYPDEFNKAPITVPTACARFKNELLWQPDNFIKEHFVNLLQSNDFEEGGHFAAFEIPKVYSEDVWSAVKKFETYHKDLSKPSIM